jgi:E3 ubiquitin-protein ligase synoviolin
MAFLLYRIIRHLFFGELRIIEHERLVERSWFAVSEAIFAMSLFRNELNTPFVIHLTVIMIAKAYHWILHDRIDFVSHFILRSHHLNYD